MKKEEINLIGQLLMGMKNAVEKLEKAQNMKDGAMFNAAKKEIIAYHTKLKEAI